MAVEAMSALTDAVRNRLLLLFYHEAVVDEAMADLAPILDAAEDLNARLKHIGDVQSISFGGCRRFDAAVAALAKDTP